MSKITYLPNLTRSSSRPDVATVQAVTENGDPVECSSHALVTAISTEASEATSIVIAREKATGAVLRCDVIGKCETMRCISLAQ